MAWPFTSPLFVFEIRHQFQNSQALLRLLTNPSANQTSSPISIISLISSQLNYLARFIYIPPSQNQDAYFCYCDQSTFPTNWLTLLLTLATISFIIFKACSKPRQPFAILTIFLASFLIGLLAFQLIHKGSFQSFYIISLTPILFISLATLISYFKKWAVIFFTIYLLINLHSLINSNFKFPLSDKMKLAAAITNQLGPADNFSIYSSGDFLLTNSGFSQLLIYYHRLPLKSNLTLYWRHVYETYRLYPIEFSDQDPGKVILLSENDLTSLQPQSLLTTLQQGRIKAFIFDNTKHWFVPQAHLEKLYQPNYFF